MIKDIHKYFQYGLIIVSVMISAISIINSYPLEYLYSSSSLIVISLILLGFERKITTLKFKNYIFQVFSFSIILSVHLPVINYFINYNNPIYKNLIKGVDSSYFLFASLFIILFIGIFCFALTLIRFSFVRKKLQKLSPLKQDRDLFRFAIIILVCELLLLAGDILFGASNRENTARIGFMTRFVPRDLFFFSAIFMIINVRNATAAKRILYIYVVVYLVKSLLMGVRGAFILPFFMGFFILVFSYPYKRLDRKYLKYLFFVVIFLPLYLSLATVFKSSIHSDVSDRQEVVISDNITSMDVSGITNWIFGRFQGYIYLVKSMSDNSDEIKKYISLGSIVESSLGSIIPDSIYESDVPTLGKVASVFFNGLSWDQNNAGAMFIFALFWLWLGWFGVFLTPILLLTLKYFMSTLKDPTSYRAQISLLYLVWIFFFSFTISGNIDYLIASLVTNLIAFNFLLATFKIYRI